MSSSSSSSYRSSKNTGLSVDTDHRHNLPAPDSNSSPPDVSAASSSSTTPFSTLSQTSGDSFKTPTSQAVMTMAEREKQAKEYVHDLGIDWDDLEPKAQVRAKKLMSPDFSWSPSDELKGNRRTQPVTFATAYGDFLKSLRPDLRDALTADPSNVFFDEKAIDDYMVIRHQKSGICPMHASALLQHYVHCKRNQTLSANHQVLDLSSFIRTSMTHENQKQYIKNGTTDFTSPSFFRETTGSSLSALTYPDAIDIKIIYNRFHELHEPILIAFCRTFRDRYEPVWEGGFTEQEYETYSQKRLEEDGRRPPLHSMVIIGAFKLVTTESEKFWFLIQNFWSAAWFHLVDGDRLCSMFRHTSKGPPGFYWCGPGQSTSLVEGCVTVDAHYSECEVEMDEGDPPVDPNAPAEEEI